VSDDGLMQILSAQSSTSVPEFDSSISDKLEEVIVEISNAVNSVTIDQGICILLRDLRTFLRDELDIYVSDRRLVKASNLLKVSAASHGRKRVDFIDCLLLQHVLWQYPEQRQQISEWLFDNMTPGTADDLVEQTHYLLRGLGSESFELVKKTMGDVDGNAGARMLDLEAIWSVQKELEVIETLLQQNSNELERHRKLLDNLQHHLWTSRDDAQAAKQQLLPLADKAIRHVNQALVGIISLKLALSPTTVSDEIRSSVIQALTNQNDDDTSFTAEELQMSLKEAKRMYQGAILSKWKSARRELE
jgi:MoxR-like ATPase